MREAMENMIRKGKEPVEDLLGDAVSLIGVHPLRARHNCALMPWQALDRIKEVLYIVAVLTAGYISLNDC